MNDLTDLFLPVLSPENIRRNESMKEHTSFKIGGLADLFVMPKNADEVLSCIEICIENNIEFFIMGNASNVLIHDNGYRGVIISTKLLNHIEMADNNKIFAQAGALLSKTANFALDNDLTGLEFASGIPGTVGGAVYMNAGAYGCEIKDIFESAHVLKKDVETNVYFMETIDSDLMRFGYRTSAAQTDEIIVLDVLFSLEKGNYMSIKDKMLELNKSRAEKQPLNLPSAGSTFKRPAGNFAGKLIMDSGLKGFTVGGAQVSKKHCGFIVNTGGATSDDVMTLVNEIQKIVWKKFSVRLEPEFKIIG